MIVSPELMALPRYLYSVSESVRSPLLRLKQSPTTPAHAVSRPLELANTAVSMETDVTTSAELTRTASQEEIRRVERELGGVYKQSSHEMSAVVENGDKKKGAINFGKPAPPFSFICDVAVMSHESNYFLVEYRLEIGHFSCSRATMFRLHKQKIPNPLLLLVAKYNPICRGMNYGSRHVL